MRRYIFFILSILISLLGSIEFAEDIYYPGIKFISVAVDPVETDFVWFGTDRCLLKYSRTSDSWEIFKNIKEVRVIVPDLIEKNFIWIGTKDGVHKYNREKKLWERLEDKDGILNTQISAILVDSISKKHIWFITDLGFVRFNREDNEWKTYGTKEGLTDKKINAISLDGIDTDDLWVGTEDGLFKYSRKAENWFNVKPPEDFGVVRDIKAVTVDSAYVLIGSTTPGLVIYNKGKNTWQLYTRKINGINTNDYILSILVDPSEPNFVWFGTKSHGVVRFDKLNNIWESFEHDNIRAASLSADKENIWVAASLCAGGGAFKFNKNENRWLYSDPLISIVDKFNLTWKKY